YLGSPNCAIAWAAAAGCDAPSPHTQHSSHQKHRAKIWRKPVVMSPLVRSIENGNVREFYPNPPAGRPMHLACKRPAATITLGEYMGFLAGKRILLTGLLSNRSTAYGIAQACTREGAELAFTYVGDRFKDRVTEFAAEFGSELVFPCDVA